MSRLEDFQRNFLMVIVVIILFIFITGRAVPVTVPDSPIVIG